MAILSTLLSTSVPHGMWESIIWAFEGATKNYVWAVVLLTVIIRLIWAPLETYNRRISAKNASMNAKLQPELKKLQEKYANDKQTLNQKTNELYKRNNFNVMGSCGFMLVFMVLNLVIFFTLFAGLNNIGSYKIYTNYENLKEHYANTLILTDTEQNAEKFKQAYEGLAEGERLEFRLFTTEGQSPEQRIGLYKIKSDGEELVDGFEGKYLTLDEIKERDALDPENAKDEKNENDVLNAIITKFNENVLQVIPAEDEGEPVNITLLQEVTSAAMPLVNAQYKATKESFLWIENIWVADSPFQSSVFGYSEFASNARSYVQDGEKTVYEAFMTNLKQQNSRANGYFILPILTLAISFFSIWLSNFLLGKGAKGQKQGKIMQFVMPVIMGLFAILYNSVFAIYMLVSQIISTALMPLQQFIVKKLEERAEKKSLQANSGDMDYRRKF